MKFIYYQENTAKKIGVLAKDENYFYDINATLNSIFGDLNEFISQGESKLIELKQIIEEDTKEKKSLESVKLLAPIEYPKRALFCLGKNYLDHAKETQGLAGSDNNIPKFPVFFSKLASPAIAHLDTIPNHQTITDKVDYEVELAVVIGKDGKDITKENASEHIFGYMIANDVSARNIQRKHGQWFKGKSLDGFCPLGPYLVHHSAVDNPDKLDIKCWVNDELRQNSNTSQMIFDIEEIIVQLSKGLTLKKGDIILTGTPAGVGLGFKPFKFLQSGDVIKCEIEGLGSLINYFE